MDVTPGELYLLSFIRSASDFLQVRLPFKELPNGAIEVHDEEDGDYCIPARTPGNAAAAGC